MNVPTVCKDDTAHNRLSMTLLRWNTATSTVTAPSLKNKTVGVFNG